MKVLLAVDGLEKVLKKGEHLVVMYQPRQALHVQSPEWLCSVKQVTVSGFRMVI